MLFDHQRSNSKMQTIRLTFSKPHSRLYCFPHTPHSYALLLSTLGLDTSSGDICILGITIWNLSLSMELMAASAAGVAIVRAGVSFFSYENTFFGCIGPRFVWPISFCAGVLIFGVDVGLGIVREEIFGWIFGGPSSNFN